jgi:hypothetical protein
MKRLSQKTGFRHEKQCSYCGLTFKAYRSTAQYCSDSCKTMSCRKRAEMSRIKQYEFIKKMELLELDEKLFKMKCQTEEAERQEKKKINLEKAKADKMKAAEKKAADEAKYELRRQKDEQWYNILLQAAQELQKLVTKTSDNQSDQSSI